MEPTLKLRSEYLELARSRLASRRHRPHPATVKRRRRMIGALSVANTCGIESMSSANASRICRMALSAPTPRRSFTTCMKHESSAGIIEVEYERRRHPKPDFFYLLHRQVRMRALAVFVIAFAVLVVTHWPYLGTPYFWDELGQFVPQGLDIFQLGAWVSRSTAPNAHPPGLQLERHRELRGRGRYLWSRRALLTVLALVVEFLIGLLLLLYTLRAKPTQPDEALLD